MIKNVDEFEQGEIEQNIYNNKIRVPDILLEEFQNIITIERIRFLYNRLKLHEIKGYVTYDKYFESMKETFDEITKNKMDKLYKENKIKNTYYKLGKSIEDSLDEIYELYFIRFREVKCFIKNDKTVFYLTDYKPENYISSYNLICSLTIFLKSSFENKIKLLFDLSDVDEDGFLNEKEIRHMITTCNFLFCEERNHIDTNSSILAQSLMNFKVNDILKQILYEPGNLYLILEEERYINFDLLYNSIIKVKDYKYNILPSFVNLKYCLKNVKKEKVIKVEDKFKKDFISVSSALFTQKSFHINRGLYKNLSSPFLGNIIKPKKVTDENDKHNSNNKCELPNINKTYFYNRKSILKTTLHNFNNNNLNNKKLSQTPNPSISSLFGKTVFASVKIPSSRNIKKSKNKLIIEKRKTLKDLLRETTIIDINDDKDTKNKTMKHFNRSNYYNQPDKEAKYIFEAYFDKIRNIEVKPGVIQFIGGNSEKDRDKDNVAGPQNSNSGNNMNLKNIISNININNINNKSIRKISEEKNYSNYKKMFSFSDKSLIGNNNDLQNSVIKEEKSIDEKENDNDKGTKTIKKFKLIGAKNITNKTPNKHNKFISNTVKREDKKHSTGLKLIPNGEQMVKIRNYSFHKRGSVFRRRIIHTTNQKNAIKIQKSLMNTNLIGTNKYKTLDEVFKEINNQENKFNNDSYGGFGIGLLKVENKIFEEQNDLKKLLGYGDKKAKPISFGKGYLTRFARHNSEKNIVFEKNQKV